MSQKEAQRKHHRQPARKSLLLCGKNNPESERSVTPHQLHECEPLRYQSVLFWPRPAWLLAWNIRIYRHVDETLHIQFSVATNDLAFYLQDSKCAMIFYCFVFFDNLTDESLSILSFFMCILFGKGILKHCVCIKSVSVIFAAVGFISRKAAKAVWDQLPKFTFSVS